MPSFVIDTATTTPQILANQEHGTVTLTGAIVTGGTAISANGDFNSINILGTVTTSSGADPAIDFRGGYGIVNVGQSGFIGGTTAGVEADYGSAFRMQTAGTIANDTVGILLQSQSGTGSDFTSNSGSIMARDAGIWTRVNSNFSEIENSGTIYASNFGIQISGTGNSDGRATVMNSGTISGGRYGVSSWNGSALDPNEPDFPGVEQLIINSGLIQGGLAAIDMSDRSDVYDGTEGRVVGAIYGNGGGDLIQGGAGLEEVYGGNGNDVILGRGGIDELYGDGGRDVVRGGQGGDFLNGGSGDQDWLDYRFSDGLVNVNLGTGYAIGGDASGDEFINFERLIGSSMNDTLTGDVGDNVIRGDNGDDFIRAGSGDDLIAGGRGADNMLGSSGVDTLDYRTSNARVIVNLATGNAGSGDAEGDTFTGFENVIGSAFNDILVGSSGTNVLTGGAGADGFEFRSSPSSPVDTITDFTAGQDVIRLESAAFTAILQGNGALLGGYFKANAAGVATDANDRILYDTTDGRLFYDSNGDGAGNRVQLAVLNGTPAIDAGDFIVV